MTRPDAAELASFTASIGRVFAGPDDEIDQRLTGLGWRDAVEEWGAVAIHTVFIEQGRARGRSMALERLFRDCLEAPGGIPILLPMDPPSLTSQPGAELFVYVAEADHRLSGAVGVVRPQAGGHHLRLVDIAELEGATGSGIDPPSRLRPVRLGAMTMGDDLGPVNWSRALALGRFAVACELTGLAYGMLTLAREHALGRVQFDRPIATFQAVRHRLADALVAVEGADAAAMATAEAWGLPDRFALHADFAKAVAGRGARTTARHSQQVLAGVGFTAEHAFHGYLKRTLVLDHLLGSARRLSTDLGARAIEAKSALFEMPL